MAELIEELQAEDLQDLRLAKELLESPSLAVRLSDAIGTPIEKGLALLPEQWSQHLHEAVRAALWKCLEVAVDSLDHPGLPTSPRFHHLAAVAAGATGGALGLPGLILELPVSTTLMLRAIARMAQREGERLQEMEPRLACLEVFALGGKNRGDDAAETGYFTIRSALAQSVSEAARYLSQRGALEQGAPALVRFISAVASRFGLTVSEKAAAMAIPAIGAAGGALVNSLFMEHFQSTAQGHFIVRRLERRYGKEKIRALFEQLPRPA